jgi:hypothetical protein
MLGFRLIETMGPVNTAGDSETGVRGTADRPSADNLGRELERRNLFYFFGGNPLKSTVSEKEMKRKERK